MVSPLVVVADEVFDLPLEITGQIVVLEQDAVLERLMPALDLGLRLRMIGRTSRSGSRSMISSAAIAAATLAGERPVEYSSARARVFTRSITGLVVHMDSRRRSPGNRVCCALNCGRGRETLDHSHPL